MPRLDDVAALAGAELALQHQRLAAARPRAGHERDDCDAIHGAVPRQALRRLPEALPACRAAASSTDFAVSQMKYSRRHKRP